VFDDLERVEPEAFGEVMGLVNSLISEHGRRVILVADEKKIEKLFDDGRWSEQNEKIVGRRAQIEADIEGVMNFALREMPHGPSQVFVGKHLGSLMNVARSSREDNLRNVRWAMHNAVAFVTCLVADPEIPEPHVESTMKVVFATTLWLRSGKLTLEALQKIPGLSIRMAVRSVSKPDNQLDGETQRAKEFSDTFDFLNVRSPPVNYPFIAEFEASGVLDAERLLEWVKSQFGFGKAFSEPTWRAIWHSHVRRIADTDSALAVLASELRARKYVEHGEILHCAGLVIRLSRANNLSVTGGEAAVEFFKSYIDDIHLNGILRGDKFDCSRETFDSFDGLGFASNETDEFREIASYLAKKTMDTNQENLIKLADTIFQEAEAGDLEAILKFVSGDNRELSRSPVLKSIAPDRLANLMLRDAPALTVGGQLLSHRYHGAFEGDQLLTEIGWARSVYALVEAGIQDWGDPHSTLGLERLQGMLRHYEQDKSNEYRVLPIIEG
jgi:hypothetical protein